jgi:PHD/YefM family antitoxin component YafN of YafNO toxin-antitoxin module
MQTLSMTEARNKIMQLAEAMERDPSLVVQVEKRGRRVMTLLPSNLYDGLVETLEVLNDQDTAARLRQALREVESGKAVPWSKVKGRLGVEV